MKKTYEIKKNKKNHRGEHVIKPNSHREHCESRPGGGGGDSSMKCPDVCVWGLKMYPL